MGILTSLGRVYVVVVNIIFLVLGLSLLGGGLFIKFGDKYTQVWLNAAKEQLQTALSKTGVDQNSNVEIDMNALLGTVAISLIVIGAVLTILSFLGCVGACCKAKTALTVYVVICSVLLVVEIVGVILLYATDTIDDMAKTKLKSTITKSYSGLAGSDVTTVAWNIIMIQMKCCGVDGYKDFENGNSWDLKETTNPANKVRVLKMPVSCCKSLPQSDDLSCAQTVSDTLNYHDTGCYDKVWELTIANPGYAIGVLCGVGIFQLLLIVSGIAILVMNDDAKVRPAGRPQRREQW
ncbi:tetraspanin-18-like [Mya arenaria]|uniref:tetraspanin-18-like n=1 Tax=Mya arenaria TaxID=6604 RepID=UPI0022E5F788|nr:tetraspanin-18-like [Mya arenaria]